MRSASAQVVASGTVGPLPITDGASPGTSLINSVTTRAGAQRAVGTANGRNRLAIVIPCHRVIRGDGELSGYGGGVERKRWLLDHEGRERRLFD